jgi:hypothetical protein
MALTDKVNGNDAERYERVKLAVIAGDNLAAKLLGKRDTKTVGEGDPASGFKLADTLPKAPVHVVALDHAVSIQTENAETGAPDIHLPDKLLVDFDHVHGVRVTDGGRIDQEGRYNRLSWLVGQIGHHCRSVENVNAH